MPARKPRIIRRILIIKQIIIGRFEIVFPVMEEISATWMRSSAIPHKTGRNTK